MALKPLSIWGAGALLATTLACSNKDATDETSSYVPPSTSNPAAGGVSGKTTTTTKGGAKNTTSKAQQQGGESSEGGSDNGGADNGGADASGGTTKKTTTKGSSSSTKATGGSSSKTSSGTKTAGGRSSVGGTGGKGGTTTKATTTAVVNPGDNPPGWWTSWKDEGWHGCAWTAVGAESKETTIDPKDYLDTADGGPYTVKGTVGPTWESVVLLGFNLAQESAGTSCAFADDAGEKVYPAVDIASGKKGIAINFAKSGAFTLRIQIQGPNGGNDENERWCQTITAAASPAFAPFDKFDTKCWVAENPSSTEEKGKPYAGEEIAAIAFTVPGTLDKETPFEFTINGFALGDAAGDAPEGGVKSGPLTGTIGGAGDKAIDFQRVKVAKDGEEYIIQNNNWGNPSGTNQTLSYSDNSFKITGTTGNGDGSGAPASFPSIYIGNNGNTANSMTTKGTDNLPKQISSMSSVQTTFTWTGTCGSGFNAAYDVWFAAQPPTTTYEDAVSGFVMVWLCDPNGTASPQPVGSVKESNVTVSGVSGSWDVWVGPRGTSGSSVNSNNPVVSFVAKTTVNTLTFDLLNFIKYASKHGIDSSWYLTDVFAGFEIWNGGSSNGIGVSNFTCVVK